MIPVGNREVSAIATAGVMFAFAAAELSEFEQEMVASICRRFIDDGRAAAITEAEWRVFCDANLAMANACVLPHHMRIELDARGRTLSARAETHGGRA